MRNKFTTKLNLIALSIVLFLSALLGIFFSSPFSLNTVIADSAESQPIYNSPVLSKNILLDGGFEDPSATDQVAPSLPNNWRINGIDGSQYKLNYFGSDAQPLPEKGQKVRTGNVALELSASNKVSLLHSIITLTPNTIYRIGLFVKPTVNNIKNCSILFSLTPMTGSIKEKIFDLSILESKKWNELDFFYKSTYGGECSFSITISSTQTLYLDDIFIQEQTTKVSENVDIQDGASIRLDTDFSGLRFTAQVNYEYFNQLKNAVAGIIILPTTSLKEGAVELAIHKLDNTEHGDVKFITVENEHFENQPIAERESYYVFSGTMDNILPQNVDRKFSARAYVRYINDDGLTEYVYSNFDLQNNSRSLHDVALFWAQDQFEQEFTPENFKILSNYASAKRDVNSIGCIVNGEEVSYIFTDVQEGVIKIEQLLDITENLTVTLDGETMSKNSQNWYTLSTDGELLVITLKGVSFDQSFPKTATISIYTDYLG